MTGAGADPGGPLVAICDGHRCAALRRLAGTAALADVAAAVRATRGAVLVTTGCVDACERGSVAGLAQRAPVTGATGPAVWLAEMQTPERTAALVDWVTAGGPLPGCLRTAVTAVAPQRG